MVYIFIIFLSFIISFALNKTVKFSKNCNEKKYNLLIIMFFVLVLSLIAGLRNINVGIDTKNYFLNIFNISSTNNFIYLYNATKIEPVFLLIIYTFTKLFNNVHICMFIVEFIYLLLVMKFIIYFSKKYNFSLKNLLISFLILCFFESFCIIRQHLSLSILLYSLILLDQKKYKKVALLFLIAIYTHYSSIFFIIMYILYYKNILKNEIDKKHITINSKKSNINIVRKNKKNFLKKFLILIFIIIIYFSIQYLLTFFIKIKILPERYHYYLHEFYAGKGILSLFDDGLFLLTLMYYFMFCILKRRNSKFEILGQKLLLIDLIIQVFSTVIYPIKRLSIFVFYLSIIFTSFSSFKNNQILKKEIIYIIFYYVFLIIYFLAIIIFDKCGYMVYPYYV